MHVLYVNTSHPRILAMHPNTSHTTNYGAFVMHSIRPESDAYLPHPCLEMVLSPPSLLVSWTPSPGDAAALHCILLFMVLCACALPLRGRARRRCTELIITAETINLDPNGRIYINPNFTCPFRPVQLPLIVDMGKAHSLSRPHIFRIRACLNLVKRAANFDD